MAPIINANPQLDIPAFGGSSSGLDDALASAVEQLYKKKSKCEDLAVPMAVFAAPPIVLQDKTVQPGGAGSVTGQVQPGDTISAGKAQKNLVLNAVASALQFSASPQTGKELPSKLPLNATLQSFREVERAQPVSNTAVGLAQPAHGAEFTSLADTAAQRIATVANAAFPPALPSQLDLNAPPLTAQMARPNLGRAADFPSSLMSSARATPEPELARSGMHPDGALMPPLVEHATPNIPGTRAEFAQLAQSAQMVGATAQNMAQDKRPNALSNKAAAPSLKAADLPLQTAPEPKTTSHTSDTSVEFMPSQQPAHLARASIKNAIPSTLPNVTRNTGMIEPFVSASLPSQISPKQETGGVSTVGTSAESTPSTPPAPLSGELLQNMAYDTMPSALSNTAAPSLKVADLPLQVAPEPRTTRHTSVTPVEFIPSQQPAHVALGSINNAIPSTLPNASRSTGRAEPSTSAPLPSQITSEQKIAGLGTVGTSVEFTPSTSSASVTGTLLQNMGQNNMPNAFGKVASPSSNDVPSPATPAQITTSNQSHASVESTTSRKPTQLAPSAQNLTQNTAVFTPFTPPATAPQSAFVPGAIPEASAQLVSGIEVELANANFALPKKSDEQLVMQEVGEITSALPTVTAFGQSAQQTSFVLPQEQPAKTNTGTKQQAQVLAIRDKNAEIPKGTEVSFLGKKVSWSASDTGTLNVLVSGYDHKKLLMTQGEIPIGIDSIEVMSIDSVESSTDKQSKSRKKR